jgi:sec-independent protein translocase protein TatB
MFDFAWTELALIGVVALVAIGPKDLPVAIKTVAGFIKKARRMASEFQGHVDEMVREANLQEVRDQFNQLRNFDIKGEIEKAVDSDGTLRSTLTENPLAGVLDKLPETEVASRPEHVVPPQVEAPSFVPPGSLPHYEPTPEPPPPEPPAFLPPGTHPPSA